MELNSEDHQLLIGYLHRAQPVHWANWWGNLVDPVEKEALGQILFDPDNDELKELTAPELRTQIIELVPQTIELKNVVWKETEEMIGKMVDAISEDADEGDREP
jgi:hypothetical protein